MYGFENLKVKKYIKAKKKIRFSVWNNVLLEEQPMQAKPINGVILEGGSRHFKNIEAT